MHTSIRTLQWKAARKREGKCVRSQAGTSRNGITRPPATRSPMPHGAALMRAHEGGARNQRQHASVQAHGERENMPQRVRETAHNAKGEKTSEVRTGRAEQAGSGLPDRSVEKVEIGHMQARQRAQSQTDPMNACEKA